MRIRSFVLAGIFVMSCKSDPTYQKPDITMRSVAYKPSTTESLFAAPWPDDRTLDEQGFVDFSGFPQAKASELFTNVLKTAQGQLRGFGLQSPIYLPAPTKLNEASITNESLFLVALTGLSFPAEKVPVEWKMYQDATLYLPGPTLAVRPKLGFPLQPNTQYALLMTTDVTDQTGKHVGPDETLFRALNGLGTDDREKANAAFYAPVRKYLEQEKIALNTIASVAVFTTQPIREELDELAAFLRAQPQPVATLTGVASSTADYDAFEGTYPAPFLQHGTPPFDLKGGEFKRDAEGTPIIARIETLRFVITIPKGDVPSGGFPIVLYSHGTGGSYKSVLGGEAKALATRGVATVGIDQVLHGPRSSPDASCFGYEGELCFFNPVNVVGGRNNGRQAALDNILLQKMLRGLTIPSSLDPAGRTITLKTDRFSFVGHSQGGLTGALYAAFAEDVDGFVLSGAGGWLTHTILVRTDPIELKNLAESVLLLNFNGEESLDEYHPVLALVQTLAEVSDPTNYGRWLKGVARPQSVYVTSGLSDPFTPAIGASIMAANAGLTPIAPMSQDQSFFADRQIIPAPAPISGNSGNTTTVFQQLDGGHFAAFDNEHWADFAADVAHGRVPTAR